ncbi:MAG: hypothetical protein LBE12_13450, partial [Planctomycetaceae bacterium]|nr:hypothetical protein [Planctomycetaceae bacterium]
MTNRLKILTPFQGFRVILFLTREGLSLVKNKFKIKIPTDRLPNFQTSQRYIVVVVIVALILSENFPFGNTV